jgi:hypothetical protein
MRLPPFVTAEALADLLGWANSIRRQVSQAATARGIPRWTASHTYESFYDNVIGLLTTPLGGLRLNELVLVADPDKQRTLSRAVRRMVAQRLDHHTSQGNSAVLVDRLLRADCSPSAAWLVFDVLSCSQRSEAGQEQLHALIAVIEAEDGLRSALGDYWADWSTGSGETPEMQRSADDDHEAEWLQAASTLRARLEGAQPFDDALVQCIRDCANTLQGLIDRRDEREARASEWARQRQGTLERMRAVVGRLPPGLDWGSRLLATLNEGGWDQAGPGELASDADWLGTACEALQTAEIRHAEAKAQYIADDSDASFDALTAAQARRSEERILRQAEAEAIFVRLRWNGYHHEAAAPETAPAYTDASAVDANTSDPELTASTGQMAIVGPADYQPLPLDILATDLDFVAPTSRPPAEGAPNEALQLVEADDADERPSLLAVSDDDGSTTRIIDPVLCIANAVATRALQDGRYGLAAYVARAAEALGAGSVAGAGSAVLSALCVGDALNEMRRVPVEARYGHLLPSVLVEIEDARSHAKPLALLVLAGALRPALFSSHTGASEAIRKSEVGKLGPNLHRLAEFIILDLPRRGGAFDLASIGPAVDVPTLKAEVFQARLNILEVADAAPSRTASFVRASKIWRELFQSGPVCRAVSSLRTETADVATAVEEATAWLGSDPHPRAAELDRGARKKRDEALEGKALDWLLSSLCDLEKRLRIWIVAHRRASALRPSHHLDTRITLRDLLAAAARDVEKLANDPGLVPACSVCRKALDEVEGLLDGRSPSAATTLPDLEMLLHDDLLAFDPYPDQARQDGWSAATATTFILGAQAAVETSPNFAAAFERLLTQSRFSQAERAAARLAAEGQGDDHALTRIRDARVHRLHVMRREADRLRAQADDLLGADIDGKVDPALAVRLEALSAALRGSSNTDEEVSERLDYVVVQEELARLGEELQCGADILLAPLQQEIDRLEASGATVDYLRELVSKRDLTSLRDSLGNTQGPFEARDPGEERHTLLQTFGRHFACQAFANHPVQERAVGRAIEDARHGRCGPVLDFSRLTEADRDQSVKLLQAWQGLLALKNGTAALREVLQEVRLTGVKVDKETPLARARSYRVSLDRTTDRRDCPVPAFGSGANGRLNVLVVELQSLNGTELHGLVRTFDDGSVVPVLVIVKGVLPAEQRVRFMREARKNASQNPCALLDEASILFLSTRPGRSRGDMFAIALPAGGVQPYSNASSKSSPEMFFGRAEELAKLWDQGGSCLVYGGRQLGKTALLQQVRVRHHKPPSQVVPYGSLQGQKDLWALTGQLLTHSGLPCQRMTKQGVTTAIREWLDQDIGRRLLILVDEADTFLSADVDEGYKSLIVVRDLMQETNRRCKFVFAGLHDVQRLARTPNSPLHHLGMPLGIGPLFGKDLEDARRMVTTPMAAAGIEFDGLSLPNRILSAVGFYPSLLQTFGDTLLSRVSRSVDARIKVGMPLPILVTEQDVGGALEDNGFKQDISEKFRMTLDLDERYRLITLAILHRMLELREQGGLAPPLTDVRIQELARDWWPQGFAEDASLSAFQGLLQEMVGLGVLL